MTQYVNQRHCGEDYYQFLIDTTNDGDLNEDLVELDSNEEYVYFKSEKKKRRLRTVATVLSGVNLEKDFKGIDRRYYFVQEKNVWYHYGTKFYTLMESVQKKLWNYQNCVEFWPEPVTLDKIFHEVNLTDDEKVFIQNLFK